MFIIVFIENNVLVSINSNNLKNGLKILIDQDPMMVLSHEFVNPGKGSAFNRVRLRNLKNQQIINKTFKSKHCFKIANVLEVSAQYSYFDGLSYVFITDNIFKEYYVNSKKLSDIKKWMKSQCNYCLTLFNNEVISVIPPKFMQLIVINTDPNTKEYTILNDFKLAKLETGAIVKVPLFIKQYELIKVNSHTGNYVSRVKR